MTLNSRRWSVAGASGEVNEEETALPPAKYNIVAYDYGMKRNILRRLRQNRFRVRVVPAGTTAEEVLALKPDGIFLSPGPGDPAALDYVHRSVRGLIGQKPIFGICLGHQMLSHAFGGRTFKLKFGHHGGNQPVKDLRTGRVDITAQNHGFAVDMRFPAGGVGGDAHQPQRQHGGGIAAPFAADLQRAVPSRGRARPARRAALFPAVREADRCVTVGSAALQRSDTGDAEAGGGEAEEEKRGAGRLFPFSPALYLRPLLLRPLCPQCLCVEVPRRRPNRVPPSPDQPTDPLVRIDAQRTARPRREIRRLAHQRVPEPGPRHLRARRHQQHRQHRQIR